jgi:transcriptional regulator with XRE-family HTH domain
MPTNRRKSGSGGRKTDKPEKGNDMARKSHFALAPSDDEVPLAPNQLTKQEFGRRLARILEERFLSQSDLVRLVEKTTGEKMGRDAISTYVNGRAFPTPKSLALLCTALGLTREELLPNAAIQAINDEHPALELRAAAGHPGKAWLRINRLMRFETATKIVTIINDEDKHDFEEKA